MISSMKSGRLTAACVTGLGLLSLAGLDAAD